MLSPCFPTNVFVPPSWLLFFCLNFLQIRYCLCLLHCLLPSLALSLYLSHPLGLPSIFQAGLGCSFPGLTEVKWTRQALNLATVRSNHNQCLFIRRDKTVRKNPHVFGIKQGSLRKMRNFLSLSQRPVTQELQLDKQLGLASVRASELKTGKSGLSESTLAPCKSIDLLVV